MSTKMCMTRDINSYNGFGLLPTQDVQAGVLAANVIQSITVPSNYQNWIAIFSFSPGSSCWVAFNDTAAVPVGGPIASPCVLNPSARQVRAGDTITIISADAFSPTYSVEFQIIPTYQN